eukprot:COSAG02_NODE_10167_length_2004_cov_1.422047_1_plen_668_part_11
MRAATPGTVDAYVIGFMEGSRNVASRMDVHARLAQEREALAWAAGRHGEEWELSHRHTHSDLRTFSPNVSRRDISLKVGAELSRPSAFPTKMGRIHGSFTPPTAGESPLSRIGGGEAYGSGGTSGVAHKRAEKRRRARMRKQQARLRRELDNQNNAACKIQARVRGRSSRRKAEHLRHDRERRIQQENQAASDIQRRVRGRHSRQQYERMQNHRGKAAASIQARQRGRMARRQLEEEGHAAQKIQATFRGKRTRDDLSRQQAIEMEAAATKIQARIRGRSARSQVHIICAEREREREKIAMQLSATKIQSSFRGRKGRLQVQEELAAKRRLKALEKRAVQMFQGNVVQAAFGCWLEYRAKILQLRQSSMRKMAHGSLIYCFGTWADTVAEVLNVREEAVLGCTQHLVDRAVSFDPHEALALKLKASDVPKDDMLDLLEMSQKLAQRSVGTLLSRAVAERETKALLDKSVRSRTGGARGELLEKMYPLPAEEIQNAKKRQSGLWSKITGASVDLPSPLPGVHIRLHSLARAVSDSAIVVAVEVLETVNIYPADSDKRGALRCTLRREHADGTPVAGTRVYRATSCATGSIAIGASEEQWKADPRNDPLAAPFANVIETGKGGSPPLLPWTAGTEEITNDNSQMVTLVPNPTSTDQTSARMGVKASQHQG